MADRADLIGAAGIGLAEVARDFERFIEVLAIDDVEAEQLLLGLGKGTVQHQRRIVLAQRGGGGRGQKPRDRAEPALLGQLFLHDAKFGHDGGVLFLGPGTHRVFVVIAEDGVQHLIR